MARPPATREILAERITKYITKQPDGHWLWSGSVSGTNPLFSVNHTTVGAARVAWELDDRAPLAGMLLRRTCGVARCVAPAHHARIPTTAERGRPLSYYLNEQAPTPVALPPIRRDPALVTGPVSVAPGQRGEFVPVERTRKEPPPPPASKPYLSTRPAPVILPPLAVEPIRPGQAGAVVDVEFTPPPPVKLPPDVSIVGPFRSGGIVVFTPWGTFNGELSLREKP